MSDLLMNSIYMRLHEAFEADQSESLGEAAKRILAGRGHPAWAAAQKVVDSAGLRDQQAWDALVEALALLPEGQ